MVGPVVRLAYVKARSTALVAMAVAWSSLAASAAPTVIASSLGDTAPAGLLPSTVIQGYFFSNNALQSGALRIGLDGERWAWQGLLAINVNGVTNSNEEFLIRGSGDSPIANDATLYRERFTEVPGLGVSLLNFTESATTARPDAQGRVGFTATTTGAPAYIVSRFEADGSISVLAQSDQSTESLFGPGTSWSTTNTFFAGQGLADGSVAFMGRINGLPPESDTALVIARPNGSFEVVAREGVTAPTNQIGGGSNTYTEEFPQPKFDAAGNFLVRAQYTGSGFYPVIYNNRVVVEANRTPQELGLTVPAQFATLPVFRISAYDLAMNGDWYVRFRFNDTEKSEVIVRNGVAIAWTGQNVAPGDTRTWDTLTLLAYNRLGDYVVSGVAFGGQKPVVLNSAAVIPSLTLANPIGNAFPLDTDRNGSFDDDVYIKTLGGVADLTALTDSLHLYALVFTGTAVQVNTGLGVSGIGLVSFQLTRPCAADFNNDNVRDVADLFGYINAWLAKTANADFNHDSVVDVADLFGYINAWLAGC